MRNAFRRFALVYGAACFAMACGERTGRDKTVVIAAGGDGDVIFPLLWHQTQARMYTELMFDKLADIGPGENTVGDAGYQPRLATGWRWSRDSLQVTFSLDPRARWHDGVPVRANDVRFAFQVYTDQKVGSPYRDEFLDMVDSISVDDSMTATVWYKARSAEQFHQIVYNLVPLPEHLLANVPRDSLATSAYAHHPIGNGPFRFVSWDKGVRFELAAFDGFPRGRPKLDRLVFIIAADASAAARAVIAGDADFVETISPDDIEEARRQSDIRLVPIRGYEYGFAEFNLLTPDGRAPNPLFGDRALRRALTMATDRKAMVRSVYDTLGLPAIGPFSRAQWSADTTLQPIPYDRAAAERALDSLGWKRGADGVRAKGGRALAFTISIAATSRTRIRYGELLQQALGEIGAKVSLDNTDMRTLAERLSTHKFDAALFTWRTTPSPSGVKSDWTWKYYALGSPLNAGGYHSATFDAQVDSGLAAHDQASARAHFRAAYQAAIDDAPAIWLYEPVITAAANRRLVTGDLRPDAWWESLPSWDVTGSARRRNAGSAGSAGSAGATPAKP